MVGFMMQLNALRATSKGYCYGATIRSRAKRGLAASKPARRPALSGRPRRTLTEPGAEQVHPSPRLKSLPLLQLP